MKITGKSKVFGIIGWPVSHSLSPVFHNAAFDYLGLDCCYVPLPVEVGRLDVAIKAISALNIAGLNITVPHKEGVNTVSLRIVRGGNDDRGCQYHKSFRREVVGLQHRWYWFYNFLHEAGQSVSGRSILILGAGGLPGLLFLLLQMERPKRLLLQTGQQARPNL